MDINRMREVIVLSEQLNYSKAANLLYITQPVLSRHVHDLEETLGGQLFQRDTRNVQLTEFGAACVEQMKQAVAAYDNALTNIRRLTDTSSDTLSLGFQEYAVRAFLSQFAAWFQTVHPNIEIDYESGGLDDLVESVLEDRLDLAFVVNVGSESVQIDDLNSQLVYEDDLLAVVAPEHPLSGRESITLEELSAYPLINFSKSSNPYTADFHNNLFESRDLQVETVKEVSSFESGLFHAKTGVGVFLIPQHLSPVAGDLVTVSISDEDCAVPLNLIWKKQNPKQSLQTLVQDFKIFYKKL